MSEKKVKAGARTGARTRFIVWVTKWALTKGVYQIEVEDCFDTSSKMVKQIRSFHLSCSTYLHGNEWHRTKNDAVKRAEEMRERRLRSLEKQIAKIKSLDFEAQVESKAKVSEPSHGARA